MNLATLRNETLLRLGTPARDSFFAPPIVNNLVNQALHDVDEEALWPWMEAVMPVTVAVGDTGFAVPDDWKATKALVFGDQWELIPVTSTEIAVWPASWTGQPSGFAVIGDRIEVRPVPPSTLTLTHIYYRYESELAADTDRPLLPRRFHSVLVARAAAIGSLREDDRTASVAHQADYAAGVVRMRRSMRSTTKPTTIKVRRGGWI